MYPVVHFREYPFTDTLFPLLVRYNEGVLWYVCEYLKYPSQNIFLHQSL
jgi:hypothetical protein